MPGTRLGNYEIVAPIGGGGMGRVFRARDVRLGRFVALKVLAPSLADHRESLLRLRREAQTASALNHPALVTIFDIGDTPGGEIFIAMELIDGANLRQWLREPRAIPEVLEAIAQAAEGLAAAHDSGIIHRDIKPDNIMVSRLGFAKVVDFGLAKSTTDLAPSPDNPTEMRTEQGLIVGTVAYMSPEQLRGEPLDGACDVFALGCVLQEVIAGRAPFAAASHADIIARILEGQPDALPAMVDPRIASLIRAMLDKDRQRRPSMRSVVAELRSITRSSSASSGTMQMPSRTGNRKRSILIGTAVIAILAIAAAGLMWHRSHAKSVDPSRPSDPAVADLYSRAQVFLGTADWSSQDLAIPLLEEVVKRDAKFLPARLDLAQQYARRAFARDPDRSWEQKAFLEADRILQQDPGASLPHTIRANLLWTKAHGFPHEQALAETTKALDIKPDDQAALEMRASILLHVGLVDEALADYTRALKVSPADPDVTMRIGRIYLYKGDYATALRYLQQYMPDNYQVGISLISMGRDADAQLYLDRIAKPNEDTEAVRALLLARRGKRAEAERVVAHVVELGSDSSHFHHAMYTIAQTYAQLRDPEKSVYWLERASSEGLPAYPLFARDPLLDPIRSDARFTRFLNDSRAAFDARRRAIIGMLAK